MKKSVIFLAIGAMALLLAAAVAWDSLRYVASARERVAMADAEMQKNEERLAKLLAGSQQVSPEVKAALSEHEAAEGRPARHAAYDKLVASFRQTMQSAVDPTDPLGRRFMDDIAGAINRREVVEKQYDSEWAAYREALGEFRGQVARAISRQAMKDWQAGR